MRAAFHAGKQGRTEPTAYSQNSLLLHNGPLRTCYSIFWNYSGSENFTGRHRARERGLKKEPHHGVLQYKLNSVPISAVIPQLMDHLRTKLPLKWAGVCFKKDASHTMPSGKEIPAVNSGRLLNRLFSSPKWRSVTRSNPGKTGKPLFCALISSSFSLLVLSHLDHYSPLIKPGKNCILYRINRLPSYNSVYVSGVG